MKKLIGLICVAAMATLFPQPELHAAEKVKVLFVSQSKGFTHGSVRRKEKLAPAEVAMIQLGQQTGKFDVDCTQDVAADFTRENLQKYDIVMFYTTGALPIAPEDRDYFINDWLKQKGHGFIGVHSATDTFHSKNPKKSEEYKWYWDMVGGSFNGHPWGAGSTVVMTVHDPEHTTMKPFGKEYTHKDEIYQYYNWQPEKVRVLLSLNMAKTQLKKPYHVPVAWCKAWGDGKVYVNNMGHREDTWTNKDFLKSLENAIAWMQGDAEGSTEVNPKVSAQEEEKAKAAAGG